jgi:hypothetical protein
VQWHLNDGQKKPVQGHDAGTCLQHLNLIFKTLRHTELRVVSKLRMKRKACARRQFRYSPAQLSASQQLINPAYGGHTQYLIAYLESCMLQILSKTILVMWSPMEKSHDERQTPDCLYEQAFGCSVAES